jgi:hypothetical protein
VVVVVAGAAVVVVVSGADVVSLESSPPQAVATRARPSSTAPILSLLFIGGLPVLNPAVRNPAYYEGQPVFAPDNAKR